MAMCGQQKNRLSIFPLLIKLQKINVWTCLECSPHHSLPLSPGELFSDPAVQSWARVALSSWRAAFDGGSGVVGVLSWTGSPLAAGDRSARYTSCLWWSWWLCMRVSRTAVRVPTQTLLTGFGWSQCSLVKTTKRRRRTNSLQQLFLLMRCYYCCYRRCYRAH